MELATKVIQTLEFDKIRQRLAVCAPTKAAAQKALGLMPSDDAYDVVRRQRITTDAKRLLEQKGKPPFGSGADMADICERADKGGTLSCRDLLDVADLLRVSRGMAEYLHTDRLFETVLDEVFERFLPNKRLEDTIFRSILSDDAVADEASPALADIRRKIKFENNRIKETLQKFITGATHAKCLQENIVTMRDGRYVIPVKAECRNEIKGLIHDTSASGATVFIEPMTVVDANNELKALENKEEREVTRILSAFSAEVSKISSALRLNEQNLTEIAFAFACAELSSQMKAASPSLNGDRSIRLIRARHPLIDSEKVVPVTVTVDGYDTMIITGPNTGGKTVTLKTVGLFALMVQSGLHIPAEENSSICLFDRVLVDLGDEQSIEQSLSTFSSHMVNIVSMMREITSSSLVLFDELGGGTDPVEGAALAISIIEAVRKAGAVCIATTHYAELKVYALNTDGVRNASCEFNVETLRPTYKLIIGSPGRSNAFAISEKLGLPLEIVERAREHVSADDQKFEDVIDRLEKTRIALEKEREEAEELRRSYEKFKAESEKIIQERLHSTDDMVEKAKQKAQSMVDSARISSEYIFDQMEKVRRAKESGHLGEQMEEARRAIRAHMKENEEKYNPVEERKDEHYVLPRKLRKGDRVLLVDIGKEAVLLDVPDSAGRVNVQAGIIKMRTKVDNLHLLEDEPAVICQGKKISTATIRSSAAQNFRDEIDLRGLTGDEAWLAVDKYLDEAMLVSIQTVRLIHGKGTGALKNALWAYLKGDRRIASFRLGQTGEGDGGVTVVTLK